jgi:chromosome segregation protein
MRLTAIKLAGFKSFVDPTTFRAPTNLTGIVGPNGCGKSNIIDAVRWVMGEGSAKVLRGESMSDVIFSGSSTRKPVGTATVELIFDNSDGRVGGQFAGYSEISVKRQVSRDGISLYSLNNTKCRRKDVRDLFLGTGLGARSYSIIEQGMISEVVDAKPEEIRAHLEEAAGISRYKERRRETENRIRHTRDNLSRLADLRDEVGKHLNRLKRQAAAARRYRKLKQEKRELESLLLTLQWRALTEQVAEGQQGLGRRETGLQESIASLRATESRLEKLHVEQGRASEALNEVQGELYAVAGEIAGLEQTIQHARELQQRQQDEYQETGSALQDLEKHMVLDKAQMEELTQALAEVEPALETALDVEATAAEAMAEAESAVQAWQGKFEEHHRRSTESNREADNKRAETEVLDQRLLQASRRLDALGRENRSVDTAGMQKAIAGLEEESARLGGEEAAELEALDELRKEHAEQQNRFQAGEERFREIQRELHKREGRLESLTALQEASLSADSGEGWLEQQGLKDAPRLAQSIEVEPGWEAAVEIVLGHWLESVVTQQDQDYGQALSGLQDTVLNLVSAARGSVSAVRHSLAEKVDAPDVIMHRLNRVFLADSLEQAWTRRGKLDPGESVLTREGEWIGNGWVRIVHGRAGADSMLAREKEMARLKKQISRLGKQVSELAAENDSLRGSCEELQASISQRQTAANGLHRRRNEVDGQLESRQSSIRLMSERQQGISDETAELQQQIKEDEIAVRSARSSLNTLVEQMAGLRQERETLESQRGALMDRRDGAREQLRDAQDKRHGLALKSESRRASLDSLRQSLGRMDTQFSQLQQRYLNLSEAIAKAEQPEKMHAAEMDALLQTRVETEARMAEARTRLQALETEYRELDGARQQAVQRSDEIRQELERARLQQQEIELTARSIQRQVEELGSDVAELRESLPDDADPEAWQADLERLQERIVRLEPVNLAAIQEFEEEQKRKDYLDAQNDDLCAALSTLEGAIAKIDRKTRTRFKETFERVNKGVQELFPRLFGGGHAYLELTGEDLLTTGVSIMARPPGKRVSSIHLLSGGEKALTAVSFVFAIFQLNPAPFCLLDEVDAPLDDANVARFSSMVREMAQAVQFVIVTHNKITMEMVHQMSGVTMREPGVSRLVQVDIDEAAKLATS